MRNIFRRETASASNLLEVPLGVSLWKRVRAFFLIALIVIIFDADSAKSDHRDDDGSEKLIGKRTLEWATVSNTFQYSSPI